MWYNISMGKFNCRVCDKEVIRQPGELKKNRTGRFYCSRACRDVDYKGKGNPNSNNHWTDEEKKAQSVKLKSQFDNGRKIWNKGLDKFDDPRLAKCGQVGNTNGRFTKGQKRPDDVWRNVFNSAGVRYGLQKIHKYKYHAKFWRLLREEVLKRDDYTCQHCGSKDDLMAHHKTPARMGGKDEIDNLITLCRSCHCKEEVKSRERSFMDGSGCRKRGRR